MSSDAIELCDSSFDSGMDFRLRWATVEDVLLALVLTLMVAMPVAEIALRRLGTTGISGSGPIVQHCTLVASMIGAAIAARKNRLLSIATATYLPKRIAPVASVIAATGGASVALLLAIASFRFVMTERDSGATLAWGMPLWIFEAIIPLGFSAIAVRIVNTLDTKLRRALAAVIALSLAAAGMATASHGHLPAIAGFIAIALFAAAGSPIFAILGGAAIVSYWATSVPISAMAVSHYSLVVNPSLPAIPLFTLAGFLLAEGGAAGRLVRVFRAFVGSIRGGPAVVTVLSCAFFTTFTGGSGVTILALGGLLLPILRSANYSERNALGFVTAAGALGILFPPCLPMILYAISAGIDVNQLFVAGIVPGVLLLALTAWLGWTQQKSPCSSARFEFREALGALWSAKWELCLPVVVGVMLFGGFATAVEASAVTALYALCVEVFVYREYTLRKLLKVFTQSGLLIGGVLLILGVALGLTGFLIDAEVPQHAVELVTASVHSKWLFLLLVNVFLIAVGAMMDIYSAIIVVVPLLVPLGVAFGIDPVHLGVIFLSNLELGYLIPPVGENLFIAAYRFNRPLGELARAVVPMVLVLLAGVLAITYVPALSLWLGSALR